MGLLKMNSACCPKTMALLVAGGFIGMTNAQSQGAACEQSKLISPTPAAFDRFGRAVISLDTLVVGAPQPYQAPGEAHIFVRSAARWEHEARLVPGDGAQDDAFGFSLALGNDLAVVGSPFQDSGPIKDCGAVYVFERHGTKWHRQAKLVISPLLSFQHFGISVGTDDSWIVATTFPYYGAGPQSGVAYVFLRSGGVWQEVAKLTPLPGFPDDGFGVSCAIDSEVIVVGASTDRTSSPNGGAIHVFQRTSGSWAHMSKLIPMQAPYGGGFGQRVAVRTNTLIGAAPQSLNGRGAAYVFDKTGGVWNETSTLTASDGDPLDEFGSSVALDGNTVVIGAPFDDELGSQAGAAYLFKRTGPATWSELKILPEDPTYYQEFGMSASIDGGTAVIGSWNDSSIAPQAGSAYVFLVDQTLVAYCTAKTNSLNCVPTIDSAGCPSATNVTGFEISASEVLNNRPGVLLYSIAGRNAQPFSGGTLCLAFPVRRTPAVNARGSPPPAKDCSGVLSLDMSAFAAGALGGTPIPELRVPGTQVNCQWWGRDHGASFGTTLSNALEYVIGP